MKLSILAFTLMLTSIVNGRPMYLPTQSNSIKTSAIGDSPACAATVELDGELKRITKATLKIGEKECIFPVEALAKIEFPDLSLLRIETEVGMGGERWFSIVLSPVRHTEHPTRYHISVIDGRFSRVTKSWDETERGITKRNTETLYKNNAESGPEE